MKGEVIHLHQERPDMAVPKSPSSSPNLGVLRDLCCGLCTTWTKNQPVRLGADLPPRLEDELDRAVRRSVAGVDEVDISATSRQWLISFTTDEGDARYSYSLNIPARWVRLAESSGEERA